MKNNTFTKEQVLVLLGGNYPRAGGFSWDRARYFVFTEYGCFEPYDDYGNILPGPALKVDIKIEKAPISTSGAGEFGSESLGPEEHARCLAEQAGGYSYDLSLFAMRYSPQIIQSVLETLISEEARRISGRPKISKCGRVNDDPPKGEKLYEEAAIKAAELLKSALLNACHE